MTLNLYAFLIGRMLAEQKGIGSQESNKIGLFTGVMGMTPSSLVLTNEMADRRVKSVTAVSTTVIPTQVEVESAESPELLCCRELHKKIDELIAKIQSLQTQTDSTNALDSTLQEIPAAAKKPPKK